MHHTLDCLVIVFAIGAIFHLRAVWPVYLGRHTYVAVWIFWRWAVDVDRQTDVLGRLVV